MYRCHVAFVAGGVLGCGGFRDRRDLTALADHGICRVTGYRSLAEVIDVVTIHVLNLHEALGWAYDDRSAYVPAPPVKDSVLNRPGGRREHGAILEG